MHYYLYQGNGGAVLQQKKDYDFESTEAFSYIDII